MHTKHSHLLKIRKAAALCAALFLCACSYERIPDGEAGELMTVTLSAGPAAGEQNLTTKGLTDTQEKSIHNLYILAFQPDDEAGTFRLKYYATGRSENGGTAGQQFSFSLRRSVSGAADTKLLLVANYNPYPMVNTGMTCDQAQAALSRELSAAPAFADTGIPMFGFAGNSSATPLKITENMSPLSANLLRAVARVDVGVGTYKEETGEWNKGDVNFVLTEIHVFKPQNKYTLIPILNNLKYVANGIPSVTAPSPDGSPGSNWVYSTDAITNDGTGSYCKAQIYIPEVTFHNGTVYDNDHENRMALVIGGTYNGTPNYYRIDFTSEPVNTKGDQLKDVLRNHIYRFSITNVSQSGYRSAAAAYSGQPIGLQFRADITDWEEQDLDSPAPDMLVRMNFGGINGTVYEETMKENETPTKFTILKKGNFVTDGGTDRGSPLPYNELKGEVKDNKFNGYGNGGTYKDVAEVLKREGPFGTLIIAPDNAKEDVPWRSTSADTRKNERKLDAKQACWDYRGQGHSDWRLPRLSELMLLWMNKATINSSKGFTSLGDANETYWTGTEGLNDKAYTVNRNGDIALEEKSNKHSIRCVREVKQQ